MLKSMTGYGKGEASSSGFRIKVELKSVNNRYLDITVKLPRYLIYLEESIKKLIKEKLGRGKVDVFINLDFESISSLEVKVDIPLAMNFKNALSDLKDQLQIEDSIRLSNILSIPDVIRTEKRDLDEASVWETLRSAIDSALSQIVVMRESEGQQLKLDMLEKLGKIEEITSEVKIRSPLVVEEYRRKLNERIAALLEEPAIIDQDRLAMEVAIYADKSSIDEELTRMNSHIAQFRSIIEEDGAVGRKLDFLIQEFNREVNTIGSKSSDSIIVNKVVDLKSEIEKIREQVQNIE
ncbi:YicC/YloC family endoribonuclease [Gudongella oleilytica]|uniref:YicC/YloC family endoribonuclease n=1 Tax=Gudongella oleilytica TaxID=1582259 RepID=UPI000EEB3E18|nr:YicC/YloC family endoribonuclease [Gudongella oleilytica]MDY0256950.1 YicC/YloC family endoribonuclease [Gudongella oleilytica]HCO19223.1 YicC family protein [Tissierellales bacterium]